MSNSNRHSVAIGFAPSPFLREGRLMIEVETEQELAIELTCIPGEGALHLEASNTLLEVDFGSLLSNDVVREMAGAGIGNWATHVGPKGKLVAVLQRDIDLTTKATVTLRLPVLMAKPTITFGSILFRLMRNALILGMTDIDVSVIEPVRDRHSQPPVAVMWNGGRIPRLTVGNPGTSTLAIVNAHRSINGRAWPLAVDGRDGPVPRIRLSFPPAVQGDKLLPFATNTALAAINAVAVNGRDNWLPVTRGACIDIEATENNRELLGADGHLSVALSNIVAGAPGRFPLCVTLIGFPGYSWGSHLLWLEVEDESKAAAAPLFETSTHVLGIDVFHARWRFFHACWGFLGYDWGSHLLSSKAEDRSKAAAAPLFETSTHVLGINVFHACWPAPWTRKRR